MSRAGLRPAAICFDLDGTLLDHSRTGRAIESVCEAIATAAGLDPDRVVAANARAWAGYWPAAEADWVTGKLDDAPLLPEVWGRTLMECGVQDAAVLELAVETHRRLTRQAYQLFDDVRPAIDALREWAAGMAVITNGPADLQRAKLATLGIEEWFDAIVVSGELGVAKPGAAPFEAALDALGVAAPDAWHVGDSLADDVAGANVAGLTSVWLNRAGRERGAEEPEPDEEIVTLAALSRAMPPARRG